MNAFGDNAAAKAMGEELGKKTGMEVIMVAFKPRTKDGFGLGPTPGAILPDYIEKKIIDLATKRPLTAPVMGKEAAALEEMAGCVCFALRKAAREVTRDYDRELRPHRLRATQLAILVAASRPDALPLGRMASALGMERTTLLRNVRPLVRRRLLELSKAEDSPRIQVRATASARVLLGRIYPGWKKAQERAMTRLRGLDWERMLRWLGERRRTAR